MYKAKEIEGVVYRVKHLTGGWLVEVPETEDPIEALATFGGRKVSQRLHHHVCNTHF